MSEAFKTALQVVLQIQEIDIKMIRLMRVKKERQKEFVKIHALKEDMGARVREKNETILELKKDLRMGETRVKEIQEKITKLEDQQSAVKKMEEFNALTQEMTAASREKNQLEQKLSDQMDHLAHEEELLTGLKESLKTTEASSVSLEFEIHDSISKINVEGKTLLAQRETLIPGMPADMFAIYEKLLKNKQDRVVVPIENRTCSGCHIALTAQHENLVRKEDRLVFCEHCSRILYWQEVAVSGEETSLRKRRRRSSAKVSVPLESV
ncbi:MAG: zinc ribbon domain-containing protein [Chlamydiia bacterium]|nr:zinc ribbon domain-containing protein [Chlamydiia bacterium]